jgi:hypothetical protein
MWPEVMYEKRYCFAHHAHHDEELFDGRDTKCRAQRDICLEDTEITVKALTRHLGMKIWRTVDMASNGATADRKLVEEIVSLCRNVHWNSE